MDAKHIVDVSPRQPHDPPRSVNVLLGGRIWIECDGREPSKFEELVELKGRTVPVFEIARMRRGSLILRRVPTADSHLHFQTEPFITGSA